MNWSHTLMTAAIAGITLGALHCNKPNLDASNGSIASLEKHACKGQNDCKGQGGCKTDTHACKGQNACKGQGGCKG